MCGTSVPRHPGANRALFSLWLLSLLSKRKRESDNVPPLASGKKQFYLQVNKRFAWKQGERFLLLSLAFAQEKVTKEKSARLAPVRSLKKSNPRCGSNFLRCAPLPPPPRGEAVGAAGTCHCAELGLRFSRDRAVRRAVGSAQLLRGRHSPPNRRGKGTTGTGGERGNDGERIPVAGGTHPGRWGNAPGRGEERCAK